MAHRRAARKSRTPAAVHAVATAAELPPTADGLAPITLVSYDLLPKIPEAQRPAARIVICDESHALKNREAARTRAVVPLLHSAERVLLMSGTPALSRPAELFAQVNALRPEEFPNWENFAETYCGSFRDRYGNASGSSNEAELKERLDGFMVRRDKEDVQLRLKEKRRHLVHIPASELSPLAMGELQAAMAELRQCEARLHAASGAPADMERLHNAQQAALSKCRGATADAKEGAVLRFVLEKLQSEPSRKILLFVHHKSMLAGFEGALRREKVGFCVISGDVLASKRQEVTVQFKTDESQRVALCTIKASGVGLNLTAGSRVVFGEVPWTPGDVLQCAHAP